MSNQLQVAVVGAGAVGGLLGALLQQAGERVVFLTRGRTLQSLKDNGLTINGASGDFHLDDVDAQESAERIGAVDLVLVAVKAWQVRSLADSLKPLIGPETLVIPLQNGVEAADHLARSLGEERVLGGTIRVICKATDPGVIQHVGVTPTITFGARHRDDSPERFDFINTAFENAGIASVHSDRINVALWEKFILINAMSGVGAMTRSTIGVIQSLPETNALIGAVMRETYSVGRALGVDIPGDAVARIFEFYKSLPDGGTASMQRDIMSGRPSELHDLNGAVVRIGKETGIETPINSMIYTCLTPIENAARSD